MADVTQALGVNFSSLLRLTLDLTGPDIEQFVTILATRLYGFEPQWMFERLAEEVQENQLLAILHTL